jgi:hypothetical protein
VEYGEAHVKHTLDFSEGIQFQSNSDSDSLGQSRLVPLRLRRFAQRHQWQLRRRAGRSAPREPPATCSGVMHDGGGLERCLGVGVHAGLEEERGGAWRRRPRAWLFFLYIISKKRKKKRNDGTERRGAEGRRDFSVRVNGPQLGERLGQFRTGRTKKKHVILTFYYYWQKCPYVITGFRIYNWIDCGSKIYWYIRHERI